MPKLQNFSIADLYKHDTPVTPIQSGAFNTILTDLSCHLYNLQQTEDVPKFLLALIEAEQQQTQDISEWQAQNKKQKNQFEIIVHNWQDLLNHIYKTLLPELYVFFHDDTCTTAQRRKVHKATQGVWNQLKEWQFTTNANYSPLELQIIKQNSVHSPLADDYLIGKGENADIACKILPLAKISTISGFLYLEQLAPLFDTLSTKKWLLKFISQDGNDMLIQLNYWQRQRLENFSVPDTQSLYAQPDLLLSCSVNSTHPLIQHIQQNMDSGYIVSISNPQHLQQDVRGYNNKDSSANGLIAKGNKLLRGLFFGTISISLLVLAFFLPVLKVGALIFALPFIGLSVVNFGSTLLGYKQDDDEFEENNTITHNNQNTNNNQNTLKQKIKPNSDQKTDNILLPVNLHRHAFYLTRLLSSDGLQLLQQLVSVINEAHSYLDYLEQHHPYLATSVHELIMDLTVNSILRLNQLAQNFSKDGEISDKAISLFSELHEKHVFQLFNNHLEVMSDLNASILEKQMVGFSTVGSEVERDFRDGLMELKILLKWFIAQAPDQEIIDVSADEILLNRLESETLKKMQVVFYQPDTTDEQRRELLEQVEELIEHFQSQSPKQALRAGSEISFLGKSDENNTQKVKADLLKLTDSNNLYKSETQKFIDFNKQYVGQLKKHW